MAMFKVKVKFRVTAGSVKTEEMETTVDESTYYKAQGSSSRKELDSWAKNFFPAAKSAEVIEMRKI